MYSASSVIQLAGENKANEYLKVKDIYEHENLDAYIELMRSPEFLKRVLNKLHYDVAYYAQGKFLTNEHYENSVYTVNYEVINAAVKGTKFDINFNNQDNATISYSFNNQSYTLSQHIDSTFYFPQVILKLSVTNRNNLTDENYQNENTTLFFVINELNNLIAD